MERKEAIEVIKKNWPDSSFTMLREALKTLISELKESEEDRIRKELKEFLDICLNARPQIIEEPQYLKFTNWLEKQCKKGTKRNNGEIPNSEQKPADVEPKFKKGDIIKEKETGNLFYVNSVEDFGYTLHYKNCTTKGCTMDFKYEDNYELAPSWGEDDEKIISDIYDCIKNLPIFYKTVKIDGEDKTANQFVYNVRNWLNSLKDRLQLQPQQEWSGEDEEMFRRCIGATFDHGYLKECAWLKSLRPKTTWKPTDEQMKALSDINVTGSISYVGQEQELINLYNELKKLKN